jgi:hypothetical protein
MSRFSKFASSDDRLDFIRRELLVLLSGDDDVRESAHIERVVENTKCSDANLMEALILECFVFSMRKGLIADSRREFSREVICMLVERGIDLNFNIDPGYVYVTDMLAASGCISIIDTINHTVSPRQEYLEMVMYLIDAGLDIDRMPSTCDPTIPHEKEGLVSKLVYWNALPLVTKILEHPRPNRSETRFCVETVFREVVDLMVPNYVINPADEEHSIAMQWFEMLVRHGLDLESSFDGSKTFLDVLKSLPAFQVDVPALSRLYVTLSASKAVTDVAETSVKRKRAL